jgi:transposase-like protein
VAQIEVIMRTERKRRYSFADKSRLMAECDAPGSSVKKVAARHDMAASVLHRWRYLRKRAHATASTPMQFVAFGDIDAIAPDLTNPNLVVESRLMRDGPQSFVQVPPPGDLNRSSADKGAMLLPHPGGAPGTIAIAFGSGLRVSVDSYVNEKALARVLRTLKVIA